MDYRQLKTIAERLEYILKTYPETRNSDTTLMIKLWEIYYPGYLFTGDRGPAIFLKDLYEVPTQDDAKRFRAKMNSEGKYLPTIEAVARRRGLNIDEWRVKLGYPTRGGSYTPPSEVPIKKVEGKNYNTYTVPSLTDKKKRYTVIEMAGAWSCSCESYKFMRKCKHITLIQNQGKPQAPEEPKQNTLL